MAYTPHDWETGEKITEERLDHMEQGIAEINNSFILKIGLNEETSCLTKTWNEINEALSNGVVPIICFNNIDSSYIDNSIIIIGRSYYSTENGGVYSLYSLNDLYNTAIAYCNENEDYPYFINE